MKKRVFILIGVLMSMLVGSCFAEKTILGIEAVSPLFFENLVPGGIKSYRAGIVTNQTGITQAGKRTIDILVKQGVSVAYIFVAEHGLSGVIDAEKDVPDGLDESTGIAIVSLYNKNTGHAIDVKKLADIDVIFFDMQDCGMRHYTYISTLMLILKNAQETSKKIVVFDRPNLLGAVVEGPSVDSNLLSFISIAPIPLRHGLTIGEVARYFNKYILPNPADLIVVPLKNYCRNRPPARLIAPLSPNILTMPSVQGYSFLGLLGEIRPCDVGIKTPDAFAHIGLPRDALSYKNWAQLIKIMGKMGIIAGPVHDYRHHLKKVSYRGAHVSIPDINELHGFSLFLTIIQFLVAKSTVALEYAPGFNKAVGTSLVQQYLKKEVTRDILVMHVNTELKKYSEKMRSICLYKPLPQAWYL